MIKIKTNIKKQVKKLRKLRTKTASQSKEYNKISARIYRLEHPQSVKMMQKLYNQKNPEKIKKWNRERQKRWRLANPQKWKAITTRRAEKLRLQKQEQAQIN